MSGHSRRQFLGLLGAGAFAALAAAPSRKLFARALSPANNGTTPIKHSTFVMGQVANITAYGEDVPLIRTAITEAFDELRNVDRLMSVFDETSELSNVNVRASNEAYPVDLYTMETIRAAIRYAELTGGTFDPTVEPLMRTWGFHKERNAMPTDKEILTAVEAVGVHNIKIEGNSIGLLKPSASIDLGSIAVGYAVGKAAEALKRRGVESALVEVSGDFYAIGAPPGEKGWKIGIVNPLNVQDVITTESIRDQSLATAGNYQNYVVYNAVKYGHVMDVHNGFPAHVLASATVISFNAAEADAYSTAAFVDPSVQLFGAKIIRVRNDGNIIAA